MNQLLVEPLMKPLGESRRVPDESRKEFLEDYQAVYKFSVLWFVRVVSTTEP